MASNFFMQNVKNWLSSKRCHFVKKYFYGIKLLHANVQCVYNVYAKYQMASIKALVQVAFPVYALSSTIQNYKGQLFQQNWPLAPMFLLQRYILPISKCLKNFMIFNHCLFKILRTNQSVTDRRMDGRCHGWTFKWLKATLSHYKN